ncbi:MAG: glycosyltransferase [Desulfurococcaceae archaeon]
MSKILFIYTKRKEYSAEYIRVKYFINALEESSIIVLKHEVETKGLHKYVNYLLSINLFYSRLLKLGEDVDLVITTVPPVLNAIIGYEIAVKQGKPLVVDIRDIWEEYVRAIRSFKLSRVLINRIIGKYYRALKYASLLTVTTDQMLKYYRKKIDAREIYTIPNGVDTCVIKCSGFENKEYDLVYLADFSNPYHAIEVLVDAIKNTDFKLLVVGSGKYLDRMKKLIEKQSIRINIEYTGSIPYNELSKYLCRTRVGVSGRPFIDNPEYLYTIPVKIYEYLGAGLPVLAYGPPNSAVQEFISKHEVGYYIDKQSSDVILNKVYELVSKHKEYFGKCTSTASRYDRRVIARDFAKLISKLLDKAN